MAEVYAFVDNSFLFIQGYKHVKELDIAQWTINIPHPYPKAEVYHFIRKVRRSMKNGFSYNFVIILKENSEVVGCMDLLNINLTHGNAELGYWLAKEHRCKGLTTEAGHMLVKFAFEELMLERLYAKCFDNNDPSRKVMEKLGMQYEGRARHEVFKSGKYIDTVSYAIIKNDRSD